MGMSNPETIQETLEEMGEIPENETIDVKNTEVISEEVSSEIVEVKEDTHVSIRESDILNPNYGMDVKLGVATHVANMLTNVLDQQDLVIYGLSGDKEKGYVTIEGWNTLGTMLGITPVTESVEVFPTKARFGYKARVSLYQNDVCLATAEAIATSAGFQKKEPDVYSMAQTRALGKAYRMALSWIMKLAGFEPTPAEEMPSFKED